MSKRILTVIIIIMILAGLSLLLYPTISDYIYSMSYRQTISEYEYGVQVMEDDTYERLLAEAVAYNKRLLAGYSGARDLTDDEMEEYNALLNPLDSGIMGYVVIPKINVSLPIYHGVSDGVLQNGVGHLPSSSLPVGGEGTHSVLSAHTGLPSAKLFTSIDQLVEGDTFSVRVLRETLTYEVDQILVVLPYETSALRVKEGADYCTLLTCTPYGINSHRLLVRGHRIPTPADVELLPDDPVQEALDNGGLLILAIGAGLLVLILVLLLLRRRMRKRARRLKKKEKLTQEFASGDFIIEDFIGEDFISKESISEESISEESASEEP